MSSAIASVPENGQVVLNKFLREELSYWRFLDNWDQSLPWKEEKHHTISLSTGASGHGWGCVLHYLSGEQTFGDYWSLDERELFISSKEMLALKHAVRALPKWVRNCRLDTYVDRQVYINAWNAQGSRKSPQLTKVTKQLFLSSLSSRNIQVNLLYLPSQENHADAPSRSLSPLDSKLSSSAFAAVDQAFGGSTGHTFDLMALDSNAPMGKDGRPLPHFPLFRGPVP